MDPLENPSSPTDLFRALLSDRVLEDKDFPDEAPRVLYRVTNVDATNLWQLWALNPDFKHVVPKHPAEGLVLASAGARYHPARNLVVIDGKRETVLIELHLRPPHVDKEKEKRSSILIERHRSVQHLEHMPYMITSKTAPLVRRHVGLSETEAYDRLSALASPMFTSEQVHRLIDSLGPYMLCVGTPYYHNGTRYEAAGSGRANTPRNTEQANELLGSLASGEAAR